MVQDYLTVLPPSLVAIACIFLYNYVLKIRFAAKLLRSLNPSGMEIYFAGKILGALIFGLIPYLLLVVLPDKNPADFGITPGKLAQYKVPLFVASALLLLLSWMSSGNRTFREQLMKAGVSDINLKNSLLLAAGWIIYIFGYELFFRGILWFSCFRAVGFIPALIINLAFYALAHYKMSRTAILGSVPVGIVFCCLSFFTGSFLFAFILHSTMSAGFEIISLYRLSSEKIRTEKTDQ